MKKLKYKWQWAIALLALCFTALLSFGCAYSYGEEKYTVTFMNGDEVFASSEYKVGEEIVFPENIPEKSSDAAYDYIFKGWNFSGREGDDVVTSHTVKADVTLFSVYVRKPRNAGTKLFAVTFRDSISNALIKVRCKETGEYYENGIQMIPEGGVPEFPQAEDVPDHTDSFWAFNGKWSEGQGVVITSRTEIYALYDRVELPVYRHYLDKTETVETAYGSAILLSAPSSLDANLFSFDGWFFDEGFTRPVDLGTLVDESYFTGDKAVHIYGKVGLIALEHADIYLENNTDVSARVYGTEGMDVYLRNLETYAGEGLSFAYSWEDGSGTAAASSRYPLHDAGTYRLKCTVTATYGDGLLTASRTFGNGENEELPFETAVRRAPLAVELALSQSKVVYGEGAPAVRETFEGFVAGDTAETVGMVFRYTFAGKETFGGLSDSETPVKLTAGSYEFSAAAVDEGKAANYEVTITYLGTVVTVTPRPATLSLNASDTVYGKGFSPSVTAEGLAYDDTVAVFGSPVYAVNGTEHDVSKDYEKDPLPAGSYTLAVSGLSSENYEFDLPEEKTFTVAKKGLTVTPLQADFVYGGTPAPTVSYEGFLAGESEEDLQGELRYTYTDDSDANVQSSEKFHAGSYTLGAIGLTSANYAITFASSAFTVGKAELTLSADLAKEKIVYGDETFALYPEGTKTNGIRYEGLQFGEAAETLFEGGALPALSFFAKEDDGRADPIFGLLHVGNYVADLTSADMAAANAVLKDYTIVSFASDEFSVTARPVTLVLQLNEGGIASSYTYGDLAGADFRFAPEDADRKILPQDFAAFGFAVELQRSRGGAAEPYTYRAEQGKFVPYGDYTATLRYQENPDYAISCEEVSFAIAKMSYNFHWSTNGGVHAEYSWQPEFEEADSPFTFEGTLKLKKDEREEQKYTSQDDVEWEKPYHIYENGTDVTENFEISWTVDIALLDSSFEFKIQDVSKKFDGTTVIPDPVSEIKQTEEGFLPTVEYRYGGGAWQQWQAGTLEIDGILDADAYTVNYRVRVPDDQNRYEAYYGVVEGTFRVTVGKAAYTVTPKGEKNEFTYNGAAQGKTFGELYTVGGVEGDHAFVAGEVSYSGGYQFQDVVKDHTVSYTIAESKNYQEYEGSYTLTILKAQAEIVTDHENSEFTYSDGRYAYSEKTATGRLTNATEVTFGVQTKVTYQPFGAGSADFEGETFEKAGVYTITLTVAGTDNYDGITQEFTVTIRKAQAKITGIAEVPQNAVYTGESQYTLSATSNFGTIDYTYQFRGQPLSDRPDFINAGAYEITMTVQGTENWDETTETVSFTIAKANYSEAPEGAPSIDSVVVRRVGRTLGNLCALGEGWRWQKDTDITSDLTGDSYTVTAVYTDPEENHNDFEYTVTFTTRKEKVTIARPDVIGYDFGEASDDVLNKFTLNGEDRVLSDKKELQFITTAVANVGTIGGTYLATITLTTNNNYFEFEGTSSFDDIIFKIQSVDVGGTLYTIEDALAEAKSGQTVTVKNNTSFAAKGIAEKAGYTVDKGNYTVKDGVTLILPYNGKDFVLGQTETANGKEGYETGINSTANATSASSFGVANRKKVELTVPDSLTLYNEGKIRVGGVTSGQQVYAGGTAGDYAQITLGSNAVIESKGDIDIYGFIVEAGKDNGSRLNMNEGTLRMTFRVYEHRGGSAYAAMVKDGLKGSPFNRYYMENCTATLIFKSAAHLLGYANLYTSTPAQDNTTDIKLAGNGSDEMIQLQGDSYFTMKFDHATLVADINIYGSFKLNSLQMSAAGATVNMNQTYFPFSYLQQITLWSNGETATVDCTGQDMKLFPGAMVKIEKNVTVNASNIVIYSSTYVDENKYGSVAAWKYPTEGKGNGKLVIAGTLNAKAVGGNVLAEGDGARFISTGNTITSYEILDVTGKSIFASASWSSYTNVLNGPVYHYKGNQEKQTLSVGTFISKNSAWVTDDSTFEMKYNFFARESVDGEKRAIEREEVNINNPDFYTHNGFTLAEPSFAGYEFIGWYTNESCTEQVGSIDGNGYNNETVTLYGLFQKLPDGVIGYTLTLNANEGEINGQSSAVVSIKSTNLEAYELPEPEREGYEFLGWAKEQSSAEYVTKLTADDFAEGNAATLYAQWKVKTFKLTLEISNGSTLTVTVTTNGDIKTYISSTTVQVSYGATVEVTKGGASSGYNSFSVSSTPAGLVTAVGSKFTMTQDVTIKATAEKNGGGCLAEGTLVTLADGTQKRVEDLLPTDEVLIYNHFTGKYEAGKILFDTHANRPADDYVVTNLKFANGTTLRIVESHGLFDLDLNRYVYLNHNNAKDFIGHRFATAENVNGEFVAGETVLADVVLTNEHLKIYSPMTVIHFNIVAEGMLTITSFMVDESEYGIQGFVNIFDYEEGSMKYDEAKMQADIEKYGLFTYEDFKDLIPEELFEASVWRYFKIAIGKGNLTWEQVLDAINYILYSGEV